MEWRAQQSDAMAAEVERLRWQLAAVDAQLRQYQQQPAALPPPRLPDYPQVIPVQNIVAAGSPTADFTPQPEPIPTPAASPYGSSGGYGGDGYSAGVQIAFWGWLSYLSSPQEHYDTFWAWEGQLDISKSITDRLAATADINFIDTNHGAYVELQQLYLSILYPDCHDAILTAGKFNGPFGIEARDFWYRQTGDTTLVYDALPQELTGLMYTQPVAAANVTLRAFVVNGFNDNLDINQQPSLGVMAEYRPCPCLSVAWTNWWGPEFADDNGDKLFFTLAQSTWQIRPRLSLAGEFLYGETESRLGRLDWNGYALIVSQTLSERFRLFGQWSDLDDPDGYINGSPQHGRQAGIGLSYYLDKHVESRLEYVHEMTRIPVPLTHENSDEFLAHLTFGF